MSLSKLFGIVVAFLFIAIAVGAVIKKSRSPSEQVTEVSDAAPLEVDLDKEIDLAVPQEQSEKLVVKEEKLEKNVAAPEEPVAPEVEPQTVLSLGTNKSSMPEIPNVDRVNEFFNKGEPKFPIVETITYRSKVGWQKGRPAWVSDYASHYQTSRHFIARSLHGKPDYFDQDVAEGNRFNVLRLDKKISFYLLVDLSRAKMLLYYVDKDKKEKTLVKTYNVGLGRLDSAKLSGSLTPLGKYTLGSKIAIYKPSTTGYYNGQKIEMVRVFGSRWIPFDKEIKDTTDAAKGYGISGVPWVENDKKQLEPDNSSLGKYESDGCIRLSTSDMEELFAIVITKPTTIELVRDYYEVKGNEQR